MNINPLPDIFESDYSGDALIFVSDSEFYYGKNIKDNLIKDLKNNSFQIYTGHYTPKVFGKKDAFKEKYKPTIHLIGRGETCGKQKIKIEGFLPYCYILDKDGGYRSYLDEHVKKIIFECNPKAVGIYRKKKEKSGKAPFEADIPFIRRFLCDVLPAFQPDDIIQPETGVIDVETNYPKNDRIISFAINDGESIYYNSIHEEKSYEHLILDLWNKAIKFDVIYNWNIDFDQEKIDKAYKKVTGEYDSLKRHVALFNLGRQTVKKLLGREIRGSWSLRNAGIQIAGVKKIDTNNKHPRKLEPEELMAYNCVDVIVPREINELLGVVECHIAINWLMQCKLEDTEITAVIDDISLLTTYHDHHKVLSSKPPYYKKPSSDEPSYGAADPLARHGTYNSILKFDVAQAYPTAVLAVNATPETKNEDGKYQAANGVKFEDGSPPFIEALKHILSEKAETKKKKQKALEKYGPDHPITEKLNYIYFAIKTQAAAFSHGEFGYWRSRMKDYEVAEAITSTAKDYIFFIMRKCEQLDIPWIYSHTDSIFINASKDKKDEITRTLNRLSEKFCKENDYNTTFELDFEDYYKAAYIHSAARNVLVPEHTDIDEYSKWEVTGMNFMRSGTPEKLADIEIELIKKKLRGCRDDVLVKKLRKMASDLNTVPSTKLGIIKPLNKPIHEYGGTNKNGRKIGIPYHIKALKKAKQDYGFDVQVGEKFMIIPVLTAKTSGKRKIRREKVEVAYPIESGLPDRYNIDFEKYLESNLVGKIYKLFDMDKDELFEAIRSCIPNINKADRILEKETKKIKSD